MHQILVVAMVALAQDMDTFPIPGHTPIANFHAIATDSDTVAFTWTAPTPDLEFTDRFVAYELRYSRTGTITTADWDNPMLGTVNTPLPGEPATLESCEAGNFNPENRACSYYFAIRARDTADVLTPISASIRVDLVDDLVGPGNLQSLNADWVRADFVRVTFRATGDDGESGLPEGYQVFYSTTPLTADNFSFGTPMINEGIGLPDAGNTASYMATHVPNQDLYFAARAYDERSHYSALATTSLGALTFDLSPGGFSKGSDSKGCGLSVGTSTWILALVACTAAVARR